MGVFDSYEESAALYAKTHNPFEEVALKFLGLKDKEPLQTFIMEKLNSLKPQVSALGIGPLEKLNSLKPQVSQSWLWPFGETQLTQTPGQSILALALWRNSTHSNPRSVNLGFGPLEKLNSLKPQVSQSGL